MSVVPPVWPAEDPEGRPVSTEPRPRPEEREPELEGGAVRLVPMTEGHVDALCAVGLDPELWRFTPAPVRTRGQMESYVKDSLSARSAGTAIPFVTVLKEGAPGALVVGSTRYLNVDSRNRRLEIGATWIGRKWQRTQVNTEAKLLMLRHAFDVYRCIRVEFKTDSLNLASRAALARIGAREEGVFRSHVITAEGRIRHSVSFSITHDEWPSVEEHLLRLLQRGSAP